MQLEITKKCADSLRSLVLNKFGIQLKSSHAHEIVAAYFGYSSRAALLADTKCPINNLRQAEFIVLTPIAPIKERRDNLNGLPQTLPDDLAEGVYLPLYNEKWILRSIWPTLEELGKALADQYWKSKAAHFNDLKVLKQGVKLEFHNDDVAVVVFREYFSPSLLLSLQQGKRGVVDVFSLKRIAGFIGYVKTDHYSTEAETLDAAIVKMRDFYHGIINSPQSPDEIRPFVETDPNFSEWLSNHKNRNSRLGDLASKRGFLDGTGTWPVHSNIEAYKDYLKLNNPPIGAMSALERAWKSYQVYLQKRQLLKANFQVKKSDQSTHDPRKIVFVKNVKPIHHTKRTIENFVPGNKAWVSWQGRKAIPVTVIEVDDRYYTFRVERPLSKAGEEYYVRLEEVRSTPELACMNHVTL